MPLPLEGLDMRKAIVLIACLLVLGCGGQGADQPAADTNPFFVAYDTPFNVQPFDRIDEAHFVPAFEKGMEEQNTEIAAIVENPEAPTFDNTIAALDRSGEMLDEVSRVFFALSGSNTNDETPGNPERNVAAARGAQRRDPAQPRTFCSGEDRVRRS